MLCDACGTENRTGSRFCDHCGSPLSLGCPDCGEPNRADALFCARCGGSLRSDAREPAQQVSAERRQVSVLFADLVGFTAFAEGRDAERVRAVQQQYFDAAADAITRHGGIVEKFIGDAVMAVWGTPVAHEDDAQRAVRAGLEVVKAVQVLGHGLEARAGIVTAEAAVTLGATNQGMVAGDMVNTAARLQAAADPGQVLADQATVQSASSVIAFEAVDEISLKGKSGPTRAWCAVRVQPARGGDVVEPPFVGRADELRRLKELLHAVGRERRIRLVSITGPAGIGKSRLVEELGRYADGVTEAFPWHAGRSPSYGEGLAFWALGEMVRRRAGLAEGDDEDTTRARLAATLEELVPDPADRGWIEPALEALLGVGEAKGSESLFPAWRTFFERIAERGTVVLVFEDLQWADSGTLEFIEHLLDWSRNQQMLIITLARPELLEVRPGWGTVRSNASAMALEPMSSTEMRELLSGMLPGLPEAQIDSVVSRAGGMPLYAVEMVRALLAEGRIERRDDRYVPTGDLGDLPIPASLRSLIASRLDALEVGDRSLLQHASVLGLAFEADALASVTGMSAAEVEPRLLALVRRELLEVEADPRSPERGQYRFVQSLIREVAYETLALRERRTRHLAAARHLEATESEEAAGALASHYLAAYRASEEGPEADAVAAQARVSLRAAADRAAALGAHAQAVANLEHALAVTVDPRERAALLERAAISAEVAGLPQAAEYARGAVEAYRQLADRSGEMGATALLGDVLLDAGRISEAAALLDAAVRSLDTDAADQWADPEASLLAAQSRAEMRLDHSNEAIAAANRALAIAERLDLDEVVATALVNKGAAIGTLGGRREAISLLEGAARLAEHGGWTHLELRARMNLAFAFVGDEPMRGLGMFHAAVERAERIGDQSFFLPSVVGAADIAFWTGRPEEWAAAVPLLERALALSGTETALVDTLNLTYLSLVVSAARGLDVSERVSEVEQLAAMSSDPRAATVPNQARAWQAAAARRWDDAMTATLAAIRTDPFAAYSLNSVAVHAALHLRAPGELTEILEAADRAPWSGRWASAARARIKAAVAALDDRPEEAYAAFVELLRTLAEIGVMLDWSLVVGDALVALPGDARVRAWAPEARAVLEGVEATALLALLEEDLSARDADAALSASDSSAAETSASS